jgi:hypothetical protein
MAYQKRRSATLEKAQARLRGLQSVNPAMDLGNGFTLQSYVDLIESSVTRLQTHNLALAEADRTRIEFAEAEASVSILSSRILSGIVAMYGKDSKEYEMAGGKPPSNYRRSKKQRSATGSNQSQDQDNSPDTSLLNGVALNGAGKITQLSQ